VLEGGLQVDARVIAARFLSLARFLVALPLPFLALSLSLLALLLLGLGIHERGNGTAGQEGTPEVLQRGTTRSSNGKRPDQIIESAIIHGNLHTPLILGAALHARP
jgi:hypothetical protein